MTTEFNRQQKISYLRSLSVQELLRHVDRSNPEVKVLAEMLERMLEEKNNNG